MYEAVRFCYCFYVIFVVKNNIVVVLVDMLFLKENEYKVVVLYAVF